MLPTMASKSTATKTVMTGSRWLLAGRTPWLPGPDRIRRAAAGGSSSLLADAGAADPGRAGSQGTALADAGAADPGQAGSQGTALADAGAADPGQAGSQGRQPGFPAVRRVSVGWLASPTSAPSAGVALSPSRPARPTGTESMVAAAIGSAGKAAGGPVYWGDATLAGAAIVVGGGGRSAAGAGLWKM